MAEIAGAAIGGAASIGAAAYNAAVGFSARHDHSHDSQVTETRRLVESFEKARKEGDIDEEDYDMYVRMKDNVIQSTREYRDSISAFKETSSFNPVKKFSKRQEVRKRKRQVRQLNQDLQDHYYHSSSGCSDASSIMAASGSPPRSGLEDMEIREWADRVVAPSPHPDRGDDPAPWDTLVEHQPQDSPHQHYSRLPTDGSSASLPASMSLGHGSYPIPPFGPEEHRATQLQCPSLPSLDEIWSNFVQSLLPAARTTSHDCHQGGTLERDHVLPPLSSGQPPDPPGSGALHHPETLSASSPMHLSDGIEGLTTDTSANPSPDTHKKHVCPMCSKAFKYSSSFRIHLNTHAGPAPVYTHPALCPWPGCGRNFNFNSNMRRHLRNHTASTNHDVGGSAHRRRSRPSKSSTHQVTTESLPAPSLPPVQYP